MTLARLCWSASLSLCVLTSTGFAQSTTPPSQKAAKKPAAAAQENGAETLAAQKAAARLREFAERLLSLQDVKTKSVAAARVANLLWPFDEPYARNLYKTAFALCAPKGDAPAAEAGALLRAQAEIIALVERRDAALAKQLADSADSADKEAGASERSRVDFYNAFGLLKSDPAKAVNLVERSAQSGIPPFMQSFLIMLRLKNQAEADALFLWVLNQLAASPGEDADTLLRLGAYVFTSPKIDPADAHVPADTLIMVAVGGVLVPDLTADRPNVPPPVVRAYLKTAVEVLSRQAANTARSPSFYVACRMLLPKYERHAPDLVPAASSLLQTLAADVPPQLRQESAFESLKADAPVGLDESLERIEKEASGPRRDEQYLALVADLWERSEFTKLRAVAAKISDDEVRGQLTALINFKEAAGLLERPATLDEAERLAGKVPDGAERAMLWIGIMRGYARAGNAARAAQAAGTMLASVRKVGDARRPYLLLCAAGELARFDPNLARVTLVEAVRDFNEQKEEALDEVEWGQRVEAGFLSRFFPIGVKGLVCNFGEALPPLLKSDADGAIAAVETLRSEKMLAEALLTAAVVTLRPVAR